MRSRVIFAVSIAFAACAFLFPGSARARNATVAPKTGSSAVSIVAKRVAARMVPAEAVLENGIDARKVQAGQPFRATLSNTVHLKNGMELPHDTVLIGTIAKDQMREDGTSTLALRFTKAQLKGGKVVPIQAEIMGVFPPYSYEGYDDSVNMATPWDGKTLQVDELGALSGVDFHGKIASRDSGVFVSAKKDDMKLHSGSQFSLAIAEQPVNGMSGTNGGA